MISTFTHFFLIIICLSLSLYYLNYITFFLSFFFHHAVSLGVFFNSSFYVPFLSFSFYHACRDFKVFISFVSFFARWVLLHFFFLLLFVCHCLYIILIMSSKCIFYGNYFIVILIPCLVAFEAGFHTELKAFSFSSTCYFIEQSVPVPFAHIFPN